MPCVVSSVEPCVKHLLILFVLGISVYEMKCVLTYSLTWFDDLRFSYSHLKLTTAFTIDFSLAHDDAGRFNTGSHTSSR